MKINFESELMKNQKHAVVMAPDKKFEVLQSDEGDSLFFSIGDDGVFYLTREISQSGSGWTKVPLSDPLKDKHNGVGVVRTFEVSQNIQTGKIDLALAFTVNDADFLYVSQGNSNSDFAWAKGVQWTYIPFDGPETKTPVQIADIYLMQVPESHDTAAAEYFVVDVTKANDPLGFYSRYYITPSASQKWNHHALAANLAVIQSCLGRSATGLVRPGIYTLGKADNKSELIYTSLHGFRNVPPTVSRLTVPPGTTAIAAALNAAGNSNLFVAADKAIYLFPPDNLHDHAQGQSIVQNDMLTGVRCLYAATGDASTVVWGLNDNGDLFRLQCNAGSEGDRTAWSYPIPIFSGVEQIASFLSLKLDTSVIFAHMQNGNLVQLTQDPVSAQWQQRNILLPPTNVNDMVEYNSFTTHIKVTDDNTVGIPNAQVALTANTRVGVYLNNVYQLLSEVPVNVSTDVTGVVTIVQETQTLSAVAYHVTAQNKAQSNAQSAPESIDPMHKVMGKVGDINSGTDLENLKVTNPDGTRHYLLPSDMKDRENTAKVTAAALKQFSTASKTMHPNSPTRKGASRHALTPRNASAAPQPPQIWGVSYEGGRCFYHDGEAAVARFGTNFTSADATTDPTVWLSDESTFELFWEDAWNWFMKIVHKVEEWFVHAAGDVWHFFVKLGETIYKVVVDCISAVVRAVQFVFHKIEVFFEDLIKWLGFIFEWQDILRTHSVLKNVLLRYAENTIHNVDQLTAGVDKVFVGLKERIDGWANIPPGPPDTVGNYQASSSKLQGQHSPGSNWALYHAKSNLSNATSKPSDSSLLLTSLDDKQVGVNGVFDQLSQMIKNVLSDFQKAIERIKHDIIDPIAKLSPSEIIKRLSGILGDLLLGIAKDLIDGILGVAEKVIDGVLDMLTTPLDIPILSPIYSWITETKENPKGDTLTFLDLGCLIAAIPATIIYKIIKEEAPFPDNQFTKSLIAAPDWASLRKIFSPDAAAAEQDLVTPMQILSSVSDFFALFGAYYVAGMSAVKYLANEAKVPLSNVIYGVSIASSLPYIMPNIAGAVAPGWDTRWPIMNDTVTAVWFVKTGLDNIRVIDSDKVWSEVISPVSECVINACWLVPAIGGALEAKGLASDWVGFSANGCFDLGGIIAPLAKGPIADIIGVEAAAAAFLVQEVLTMGYGVLSAAAGGLIIAGK